VKAPEIIWCTSARGQGKRPKGNGKLSYAKAAQEGSRNNNLLGIIRVAAEVGRAQCKKKTIIPL
jgi:hypothetical protein